MHYADNRFVEQAEYIDTDSFLEWSAEHPDEEQIIRKLSQGGAKLITGPRGCGKTTLMLKTLYKLEKEPSASSLPVYVNFKSSLKLEPLYASNPNAVFWFNQWILFKIYRGIYEFFDRNRGIDYPPMRFGRSFVDSVISNLELGRTDIGEDLDNLLTVQDLTTDINELLALLGKSRCVLLLDDAAHAFSPQQQRDFFDFFRQIKSRTISPKAAIYPGVTTFSSTFHVGHDAEEIDVWIKPDSVGYIDFMMGLLGRRLPPEVFEKLKANSALLALVCFSAFGMPRALLNMIRNFYKEDDESEAEGHYEIDFDRNNALRAINFTFENTHAVFSSLRYKLPIYENFVNSGELLFDRAIRVIKEFNKGKNALNQSVEIAIKRPIPAEFSKLIGFFQYAGLILPKGEYSRGDKGIYELFTIHYAALVDRNALFGKRAINVADYAEAFANRPHHLYPRLTTETFFGVGDQKELFRLALPPCQVCNTPRANEHAKFCLNCGAQLKTASLFESIIELPIDVLPLTPRRIQTIKAHSQIEQIKDILMDIDFRQLRGVPQIGPRWAKRIMSSAEEYIG